MVVQTGVTARSDDRMTGLGYPNGGALWVCVPFGGRASAVALLSNGGRVLKFGCSCRRDRWLRTSEDWVRVVVQTGVCERSIVVAV